MNNFNVNYLNNEEDAHAGHVPKEGEDCAKDVLRSGETDLHEELEEERRHGVVEGAAQDSGRLQEAHVEGQALFCRQEEQTEEKSGDEEQNDDEELVVAHQTVGYAGENEGKRYPPEGDVHPHPTPVLLGDPEGLEVER